MGVEEKRERAKRIISEASIEASSKGHSVGDYRSDVEELREVLETIADFIKDLSEPIEKILGIMLSALDGSKLGQEVSRFYRELVESGMPEEEAISLTREFFKARIEAVNVLKIVKSLSEKAAQTSE
ncbi:MAG: hypothetical protein F7B20_05565 [Aeropyrum sp.]|nr:hypothetical protein [Aeropyrum sp.]